jgi:broad specificity phosphatase PhoE
MRDWVPLAILAVAGLPGLAALIALVLSYQAIRATDALAYRLATAHSGHRLAVFIHRGLIGQALPLASGSRPFAFLSADNGSISRLVITGQHWLIRGFDDTAQLDGHRRQ